MNQGDEEPEAWVYAGSPVAHDTLRAPPGKVKRVDVSCVANVRRVVRQASANAGKMVHVMRDQTQTRCVLRRKHRARTAATGRTMFGRVYWVRSRCDRIRPKLHGTKRSRTAFGAPRPNHQANAHG